MLPASSSFSENQRVDSSNNKLVVLLIFSFIYIALDLETRIDLKNKKQSLVIGSYLSFELWDYKNFKCKDVINTLKCTISPSNIYKTST